MAAPIDWSAIDLCIDSDLTRFETDALQWTGADATAEQWRGKAKDIIGLRLDLQLKNIEVATDAADVKDLIGNPAVLIDAACYLTLHLIANDKTHAAGDLYDRKAQMYFQKYESEIQRVGALLNLDTDEDGTIQDAEKYNAPTGVRIKHGG